MTTPRLILCPPTAAALDRLNDCRKTFTDMDIEYKRHGDSIDYRQMLPTFRTQAAAFTSELLRGAVYTDAEPDPRVAALRETIEDMARQFGHEVMHDGAPALSTGGLSALEDAFSVLGWDDPHPMPERACQFPGCTAWATCGSLTSAGYKRTCGEHFRWDEPILTTEEARIND